MNEEKFFDEKAKDNKQIPNQLNQLRQLLDELDKSMVDLAERLTPVLYPTSLKANQDDEPIAELAPLANLIRERCDDARKILQLTSQLTSSLQL